MQQSHSKDALSDRSDEALSKLIVQPDGIWPFSAPTSSLNL
jgi:hypothetical protein